MLRKVGESAWPISEKDAVVSIKDASYPIPFPQGLEFNSPAHGCWNIVHTGMLIPEAHQIYVCADNCMRGVVLTAAEMHAENRFSFVIVEEQNLLKPVQRVAVIEAIAALRHAAGAQQADAVIVAQGALGDPGKPRRFIDLHRFPPAFTLKVPLQSFGLGLKAMGLAPLGR